MELAVCKPFCTVCLSFPPLHELRRKHLQTPVSVPSAEAMLLAMLHAISRDTAWLVIHQCLLVCYIWKWGFCLRASPRCKALKCMLKCSSAASQGCWFASVLGGKKGSSVQPGSSHISAATFPGHKRGWWRRWDCSQLMSLSAMTWALGDAELLPWAILTARKLLMWPGDTGI